MSGPSQLPELGLAPASEVTTMAEVRFSIDTIDKAIVILLGKYTTPSSPSLRPLSLSRPRMMQEAPHSPASESLPSKVKKNSPSIIYA